MRNHVYQMQKASKEPLDSCEETILNETGGRPVGDVLCEKAAAHAGEERPQFNITVGLVEITKAATATTAV